MTQRDAAETTEEVATDGEVEDLHVDQVDETHEVASTPTLPALPEPMWRGLVRGVLLGALLGVVVLVPFGFITIDGLSLTSRLLTLAVVGAVGGGVAGAVYCAGAVAEADADEDRGELRHGRHLDR